ncbi:tumor necrosis factor receptor superfamily member 16-like [Nothoprocta perdicaria]|uniref:tumor necrosis factor receptor superfamily member 16-like n=1 Tax=Nothoprocta perdicaria TaxID=30464 RepID=UPI000E1B786C|nr:tumor necrosis factor receptor superfamily member 16-like [Nothoprocta perdicaria]
MRRERAPLCLLVVLQLCPAQVPSRSPACPSGAYTATGACCSLCPPGFGAAEPCGAADTRGEPCGHARSSSSAPPRPCGAAGCAGSPARRPRSAELRVLKRSGAAPNASAAGEPEPEPPEGAGKNIIPVYCSILAAVVVGLLAYVAFKCWHGCKQKQQLAKARAGELGTAPDGEKLHGDSGVFLDTHSLQEPHGKGEELLVGRGGLAGLGGRLGPGNA